MPRILCVCTANVCRSAFAAALLAEAVDGGGGAWEISSAGTGRHAGLEMCPLALGLLPEAEPSPRPVHRSVRIDREAVLAADLILTAERGHRAAAVALDPAAASRAFTLREAAALAPLVLEQTGETTSSLDARELVDRMHALRPMLGTGAPARRPRSGLPSLFRRPARDTHPLDIADGHNIGPRQHARTLEDVRSAVGALAPALAATG